jgi:hypothetical protein
MDPILIVNDFGILWLLSPDSPRQGLSWEGTLIFPWE